MALKRILDTLEGVDEAVAVLYVEKDGKFYLDVEGEGDVDALKRARDREAQAAKDLRTKLADEQAKREDAEAKLAEANGGKKKPDDLQKAFDTQLAAEKKKAADALAVKDAYIKRTLIDAAANAMATEIFTVPALGAKAVKERLIVDFDGDEPALRVLGSDGTLSAMSLQDLRKELVESKEYAPIIVGSKASGGGANGGGKGNGGAGPKPYEMTGAQRAEWKKSDPAGFNAALINGDFNAPSKS